MRHYVLDQNTRSLFASHPTHPMLGSPTTLPDGSRVRVRLPHVLDRQGLRSLHDRLGLHAEDLEIARALRFDPRTSVVACATVWADGGELLVAYGAIELGGAEPHLLVCDEVLAPGVGETLTRELQARAGGRSAA